MPQAILTLVETISTILPSAANILAIAGVCSKGVASQSYTYDPETPPSTVQTDLGDGTLTEAVVTALRIGRRRVVAFPVTPSVAGVLSSVTEETAMPNVTLTAIAASGLVLVNGPYDSLHVALKVTTGGAEGVGKFQYCLDDQTKNSVHVGTWSGDITIPIAKAAELVGTIEITPSVIATLDTKTFIIDSDTTTAVTITFSAPASKADVLSQINTGNGAKFIADFVGADKLRIRSITTGTSGTIAVTTGTANDELGFTDNDNETGTDATYDIPNTGVRTTWASGTYPVDAVATFNTTMPRFAAAALSALFTRVHAVISQGTAIGGLWIVQEDADAIDSRTMVDAFSTQLTASRTAKFYINGIYQLAKEASDSEVVTYVGTFTDPYLFLSGGDFRAVGGMLPGSRFHRPASWVGAWKWMRDRYSSDLGNHSDRALNTAFGVTEIGRDERTASVKLATFRTQQTANGGGFLVLETPSNSVGEAYFYRGRTMAQAGSILGDGGSMRVLLAAARQAQRSLDVLMNSDVLVRTDGTLVDVDSIKDQIETPQRVLLFEDPEAPNGHASAISVADPTFAAETSNLGVSIEIQRHGQIKGITATIGTVETLSVSEEA